MIRERLVSYMTPQKLPEAHNTKRHLVPKTSPRDTSKATSNTNRGSRLTPTRETKRLSNIAWRVAEVDNTKRD